ncbi:MAG: shikimate dehydrogenase [Thermoleophilia bacterium]
MKITGNTKLIGILGNPISHTLSPRMQNAAFEAMGLEICYVPLEVAATDLKDAIHGLKAMRFLGANITIPHKVQAAQLVDRLEGAAAVTGAVNTIVNDSGSLVGHNTDGTGFIRSLEEVARINFAAEAAILIGAGGAARSIAAALAQEGISQLAIINRTRAHAEEIKSLVLVNFPDLSIMVRTPEEDNEELLMGSKLVINATSAGLEGNLKMPPVAVDRLTKDHVVCDIVYTQSQETPFLAAARGKGASTLGGLGMLLHQGAAAIQLWTGFEPPIDVMRGAIES